ncbi:MAG: helix-turn-helix transcriptional regulator [Erysipelotrichaceae bacterium]|nr:helix-turn-helix transcriptional regulator [Erysipelotrichaceae bacterium]
MCTTTRINMIATGNNITRLRKEKGISIKQIQETMGFNTPQAIFKWQRGESMPTLDNIVVLSELFNTTIEEIVVKEK